MSSHDLTAPHLSYSGVESRRFGMRVFRGHLDSIDPAQLLAVIVEQEVDLAILRLPAARQHQVAQLRKTGLPYIIADTLVYYSLDIKAYMPVALRNQDLVFIQAGVEDLDLINTLVEITFSDYTNHYTSNPYINKQDILNGYQEWAASFLADDDAKLAWLVQRGNKVIGFATCSCEGDTGEGVLYGVIPGEAGQGVYTDIIRFTQQQFKAQGLSRMIVITQIQNMAVQRVWSREGFTLSNAEITIHIISLLNKSALSVCMDNLAFSSHTLEQIRQSDAENNQAGRMFQQLCQVYQWADTEFLQCSGCQLHVLEEGRTYQVQTASPLCNEDDQCYLSTIRICDENNNLCMLLYVETSHPPFFQQYLTERS